MAGPLKAETGLMLSTASTILTAADSAKTILGQLQSEVDDTAAVWQGQAQSAYHNGSAELHADLSKSQQMMQTVSDNVSDNSHKYGHTDGSGAQALSNTGLH